jgi:uncharacterized protein (DUF1501 family)
VENVMTSRRYFLGSLASAVGTALIWPHLTHAATGDDTRFVLVFLRGGLDGLHALMPNGDPAYAKLRGALAGDVATSATKLDGTFALHPSLAFAASLYADQQFLPIVGVAPPYWGRSHFDAQDCVENGTASPHGAPTGWLNRCVAAMPGAKGLAAASVMPLAMRGQAEIETWTPPLPRRIDAVLAQRLEVLYAKDARLDAVFRRAIEMPDDGDGIAGAIRSAVDVSSSTVGRSSQSLAATRARDASPAMHGAPIDDASTSARSVSTRRGSAPNAMPAAAVDRKHAPVAGAARLAATMRTVGGFMSKADGPRVAFVEDTGWDTHANEAAVLRRKLDELDSALRAFHEMAGAIWQRTVVAIVTEFGRTAAVNGTGGTDHGSGGVMFLAGGAIRGGRVAGDFAGLGNAALYEQRDLRATTDLRGVFKGVLAAHLGVSESALEREVFPSSAKVEAVRGLTGVRSA